MFWEQELRTYFRYVWQAISGRIGVEVDKLTALQVHCANRSLELDRKHREANELLSQLKATRLRDILGEQTGYSASHRF